MLADDYFDFDMGFSAESLMMLVTGANGGV
jgi:hypothetical protein